MSPARVASARNEVPIFFPADGEDLFGILTHPTEDARGTSVVYLSAGGRLTSLHRDRFPVRLSRRLAAEGFHALRFDFHGAGESSGLVAGYRLDLPFLEDVEGALRCVERHGIQGPHVLVGLCFGARTALASASVEPRVAGLVLIAPPLGDFRSREGRGVSRLAAGVGVRRYAGRGFRRFVRGFFLEGRRRKYLRLAKVGVRLMFRDLKNRIRRVRGSGRERELLVSPDFIAAFEAIARRRMPVLLVYGEEDAFFAHFQKAREGRLGEIMERMGSLVEVRMFDGEVQGLTQPGVKDALVDVIAEWLTRRAPGGADREAPDGVWDGGGKAEPPRAAPDA